MSEYRQRWTKEEEDILTPLKGYTIDNIQWVHKDVNFMKQDFKEDYYINICKLVAENHK